VLSQRDDPISNSEVAAKLDACTSEVRKVVRLGHQVLDAIADLKMTFLKAAEQNPTQQNR